MCLNWTGYCYVDKFERVYWCILCSESRPEPINFVVVAVQMNFHFPSNTFDFFLSRIHRHFESIGSRSGKTLFFVLYAFRYCSVLFGGSACLAVCLSVYISHSIKIIIRKVYVDEERRRSSSSRRQDDDYNNDD